MNNDFNNNENNEELFEQSDDYKNDYLNDEQNDDTSDNQDEQEDKRKKRLIIILLLIILFVLVAVLGIKLFAKNQPPVEGESTSKITATADKSNNEQPTVKNPIDFKKLKEGNKEIFAWIKVDDTEVDYPICQSSTSDEFYLKHKAEDKSWSASGAIYIEFCNSKGFNDPVTLIYGHNGYGTTMFTTLHRFEDTEFFDSHPYFYIYTTSKKLTYQVVSAFKYDNRHIMNSFNFDDEKVFASFCSMIQNPDSSNKNVRSQLDTQLTNDSKIVVLSTCITNQKSSRYLVCGVLVNDEKTN